MDRYVDDIAYTCQVSRSDLNVVSRSRFQAWSTVSNRHDQTASPKGLIAGLHRFDGADRASMIHAPCRSTAFGRLGHLKWILVIEKEVRDWITTRELTDNHQATFNALLERQYHQNQTTGPGLLVTVGLLKPTASGLTGELGKRLPRRRHATFPSSGLQPHSNISPGLRAV